MPHPSDILEPADDPAAGTEPRRSESPEFRRELKALLNRHSIDTEAEMPDFILAHVLADMVPVLGRARVQTARWMGQPLLGEKLSASLQSPDDPRSRWRFEAHPFVLTDDGTCEVCGLRQANLVHNFGGQA